MRRGERTETAPSADRGKAPCLLRVEHVSFAYRPPEKVLCDVSLAVAPGEVLTLLGPNGAGKSTLLCCMAGLLAPQEGTVLLSGIDLRSLRPREIAQSVAFVQQASVSAFAYRVRDYVAMGRAARMGMFASPSDEDVAIALESLELLGVGHLADCLYTELSGGQRQMVNICRAVAQRPKLILFDEPTSALDFGNQIRVLNLVRRLAAEGFAAVMSTHNPDHPILLGGNVAVLNRNGTLEGGAVEEVLTSDRLSALYDADLQVVQVDEVGRKACLSRGIK